MFITDGNTVEIVKTRLFDRNDSVPSLSERISVEINSLLYRTTSVVLVTDTYRTDETL